MFRFLFVCFSLHLLSSHVSFPLSLPSPVFPFSLFSLSQKKYNSKKIKKTNHGLRYCARLSPAAASSPATAAAALAATAGDGSSRSSPRNGSASGSSGK